MSMANADQELMIKIKKQIKKRKKGEKLCMQIQLHINWHFQNLMKYSSNFVMAELLTSTEYINQYFKLNVFDFLNASIFEKNPRFKKINIFILKYWLQNSIGISGSGFTRNFGIDECVFLFHWFKQNSSCSMDEEN